MTSLNKISIRSQSVLLIFILLSSGMLGILPIQSADADAGRSTGTETLTVDVLGDYYDRGTNMTLVATASNLDTTAEYTLEYTLCRATGTWDNEMEVMNVECTEWFDQVSGTIDLGSGNLVSLSATSIADTGCCDNSNVADNFDNGTMMFSVNLTSQSITMASESTDIFALGSEVVGMHLGVSDMDILLGMEYGVHAFFDLEYWNLEVLSYTVNCSLIDQNGTAVDSTLKIWNGDYDIVDPYFDLEATGDGMHYPHCDLIRNADSAIIASQIGASFDVIDSDYSGYEAVSGQTDTILYEHNDTVSLTVPMTNLFIGAEYVLTYSMCYTHVYYDNHIRDYILECGDDVQYGLLDDPLTTTVDESEVITFQGEITFTPTASTHVEQLTFTLPSCCGDEKAQFTNIGMLSVDSLENESLTFDLDISTRNVSLNADISNTFILGGEVVNDHLNFQRNRILIGMNSLSHSRWTLDTMNSFTLSYTIQCSLFNSTGVAVDNRTSTWSHNGHPAVDVGLYPPTPGTFHTECNLTRNLDSKFMGSQTSGIITVLDENYTGNERHSITTDSIFYPHNSSIGLSIETTNMYPGTTYTIEYTMCSVETEYDEGIFETECKGQPSSYSYNIPAENQTLLSGSIDFTPTSSSYTEVAYITVPECCGDYPNNVSWWFENSSVGLKSRYFIQDVQLNSPQDESNYFGIGGSVESSQMLHSSLQLLPNMNVYIDMLWMLDHRNEFIQTYQEQCNFFDASDDSILDSSTATWNHRPEQVNTMNSMFSPPGEGDYYVECSLTRVADSTILSTHRGENISVLPPLGSQDDATINVNTMVKPDGWALVLVSMAELDAGQQYSFTWDVFDVSTGTGVVMDSGDYTWVEGTDSTEMKILEFNALADSTYACIVVELSAADEVLVSLNDTSSSSSLCWIQNSVSDIDTDGVYDKNDECPATPYGSFVQLNGCSDTDLDGWDDSVEIDCNSDYQNPTSVPVDYDQDGICDPLDDDDDGDGFTDEIEYLRGTNPYDYNDFPINQLPVCTFYYTLEIDGMPAANALSGDIEVSTLVIGSSSVPNMGTGITPILTVPSGNYFMIVTCQDLDNDPVTLSVNDVVVGPALGEVTASAMITLSADVSESVDANITWSDGTNSATTFITVNLENTTAPSTYLPGFTALIGIIALLGATVVTRKSKDE